jgi:hypothetical protein
MFEPFHGRNYNYNSFNRHSSQTFKIKINSPPNYCTVQQDFRAFGFVAWELEYLLELPFPAAGSTETGVSSTGSAGPSIADAPTGAGCGAEAGSMNRSRRGGATTAPEHPSESAIKLLQ